MFFGLIKIRRVVGRLTVLMLLALCALNWFARQPYEFQQRFYSHLPRYAIYKIYYLSNISASMTDFIGLTGNDCFVPYSGELPVNASLVGGTPLDLKSGRALTGVQYLNYTGFDICYAPHLRHPLWVSYKVTEGKRQIPGGRPNFKKDASARNSPAPNDYQKSGYDRGHMAPNYAIAVCHGAGAQRETFLLSNICPQKPSLNRGPWRKLEHMVADIWPDKFGDIYVITGAHVGSKPEKLDSGVSIPEGFYKIMIAHHNERLYALAVYMKQSTGYSAFPRTRIVSIDHIEELSGLDFLPELPDEVEARLEAGEATRLWPANWRGCIRLIIAHFEKFDS